MTALTKADMADHLSELTSLNRREAKQMVELFLTKLAKRLLRASRLSFLVSVISSLEINASVQDVIRKLAKKFRFLHAV